MEVSHTHAAGRGRRSGAGLVARLLALIVLAVLAVVALKAARSFYYNAADYGGSGDHPEILRYPERTGIGGLTSVSFPGLNGELIRGWYVPSRNRAAIIVTGGTDADRSQMLPETRLLWAAGFGVLAFDWPGTGLSGGHIDWGRGSAVALSAAVEWLSRRADVDPARIGAFGFSAGGFETLRVANRDTRITCAVLAGTPSGAGEVPQWLHAAADPVHALPAEWAARFYGWPVGRVRAIDLIGAVAPRPVLILTGLRDPGKEEGPAGARALYRMAGEPKSLWIVPGAGHGGYVQAAGEGYAARILQFFRAALLRS